MNFAKNENIYNLSKSTKKKFCINTNFYKSDEYFIDLKLLCKYTEEKIEYDENVKLPESSGGKLFCNACKITFNHYTEMRLHQWKRSHQILSGWKKADCYKSDDESDNDENDNKNSFNVTNFEEEIEVDNDDENEDNSENENLLDTDKNISNDGEDNSNHIFAQMKLATFHECCTFDTIYFQNSNNQIVGIERCLLFQRKKKPENPTELMECANTLFQVKKIAMFLYSGGCFSGAIYEGNTPILHKTIKRYTVRKKQGGSELTHGSSAKSGGGYLRMVNTEKLFDDVYNLIHVDWAEHVRDAGLIIVWSSRCQRYIFGSQQLLNNTTRPQLAFDVTTDPRVRHAVGRVAKVTSSSLHNLFEQLTTVEVYDKESIKKLSSTNAPIDEMKPDKPKETDNQTISDVKKKKKRNNKNKNKDNDLKENKERIHKGKIDKDDLNKDEDDDEENNNVIAQLHPPTKEENEVRTKILNYVLNDSVEDLQPYLQELRLSRSYEELSTLISIPLKSKNQSLLHLAVRNDTTKVIGQLLEHGCDPILRNDDNETAYAMGLRLRRKSACEAMSGFMISNPSQYDYYASKFPGGRDPLKEHDRREWQKLKKKQYKKERNLRLKEAEKVRKAEESGKKEMDEFIALNNNEKAHYIRQIRNEQKSNFLLCYQCARNISDIIPFTYSDYPFCTVNCLRVHRLS